jgi:hypothetical protein
MCSRTLVIEGVDLELLEEQRQALAGVTPAELSNLPEEAADAINGIQHMLDHWADVRDGVKQ